jgi:transcriptional regulator of acetoin/glycerol metabolism
VINQFEKYADFRDHMEKLFLEKKLLRNNWNISKTAEEIDVQRSQLYARMEKFNMQREGSAAEQN